MAETVLDRAGEQIADTAHKASRAASAAADAFENGVGAARRAAKQGCCSAAELIDDTKRRVRKYPMETVATILAAGIAVGAAIGCLIRRSHSTQASKQ